MSLSSTGAISFNDLATEFGDAAPLALNEFYAGGAHVPSMTTGKLGLIPSVGALSLNAFRGSSGSLLSGAHWTNYSALVNGYGPSQNIAVGGGMMLSQFGLRSFDSGLTWQQGVTNMVQGYDDYDYGGGKFWSGYTSFGVQGHYLNLRSSDDGLTWSNILLPAYEYTYTGMCAGSVYYQTRYCVVGSKTLYGYTVWMSVDGITFNNASLPVNTTGPNLLFWPEASGGVDAGGDGLFVNYGGVAGNICTSPDGVAWTKRYVYNTAGGLASDKITTTAVILNGKFIALTSTGKTVTSSDGITFTVSNSVLPNAVGVYEIESSGSYVLALYRNSAGAMISAYTLDGVTWTPIVTLDISTATAVYWLKCVGSRFVAMLNTPGVHLLWTVPV